MRILVESLKRLFFSGKITKDRLEELLSVGKITAEERDYITNEETGAIVKEERDTIIKEETGSI